MKFSQYAVVLLFFSGAQAARAQEAHAAPACQFHELQLPVPAGTAAPIKNTKITLLGVDPSEGGYVRKTTVIGVDVEYQIAKFEPDKIFLMPLFPTSSTGGMAPGNRGDFPFLKSAAGKVHMCVPLGEVYDHRGVIWPLSMNININLQTDERGSSRVLAQSRSVKFNALDIPAGALERQAAAPPVEYQDALLRGFGYFEKRGAMYKVCIQHYQDMQAAFTTAYRRWEARHAEDIRLVNERQFDFLKSAMNDSEQAATHTFDLTREANIRTYENMNNQQRRGSCQSMLQEFQDPEDMTENAIGDQLAILRAWHPPGQPK